MTSLQQILEHKIVAIVRGARPADVVKIADALYKGGIKLLEVTLNSPDALLVIERLSSEMKGKTLIGAGTVLDAANTKDAISAGALFIISPVLDKATIETTKKYGAVSMPGAYTPTEIFQSHKYGGDIIKVFPALSANYIKDLLAPLPHIPLMPTGGINLQNIKDFQRAGAVAFGVGSALVDTKQVITEDFLQGLTQKARQMVKAIAS